MKYALICLFLVISLFAYPTMEDVANREISVGDTINIVIQGDSWQHNNLTFEMSGAPDSATIVDMGHIGGCYCSLTNWGARFIFAADSSVAGDRFYVEFKCIDTLGAFDKDTMELYIFPIYPVLEPLPDMAADEHDTISIDLTEYIHDPDEPFETIDFNVYHDGTYNVWIEDGTGEIRIANPDVNFEVSEIILEVIDNDSATVYDTFSVVFRFVDDPPVINDMPVYWDISSSEEFTLNLADYASDPDTPCEYLTWSFYGEDIVSIELEDRTNAIITSIITDEAIDTVFFILTDTGHNSDTSVTLFHIIPDKIDEEFIPEALEIGQPYPNPFNGKVAIDIACDYLTIAYIYDMNGNLIQSFDNVSNEIIWDGTDQFGKDMPSGTYKIVILNKKEKLCRNLIYVK